MLKKLFIFSIFFFYVYFLYFTPPPKLPNKKNKIIFYSNKSSQDLRKTILYSLKKAKKSVFIIIFSLRDKYILDCLKNISDTIDLKIFFDKKYCSKIPIAKKKKLRVIKLIKLFQKYFQKRKILQRR